MLAFFGAELRAGVEMVIEAVKLRERLRGADLCITGEGKLDAQSLAGKTPIGVARVCRQMGVPCVALAGAVGEDLDRHAAANAGITALFSIAGGPCTLKESMEQARGSLARVAWQVARLLRAAGPRFGCWPAQRPGG
jgi:glycerate kinase